MASAPAIRIATRGSPLAMWQARHVARLLQAAHPDLPVEFVPVRTRGDRDRSRPLAEFGAREGVGLFTREVQRAVLDGRADVAVHSLKDLPTDTVAGMILAAVPARGPTADALVLPKTGANARTSQRAAAGPLPQLAEGARVGTGSIRRIAQLRHVRPDLQFLECRGNVQTRLRKLDEDATYDALVLAEAGLVRLELSERISVRLEPPLMLHAVGQGALGIECRAEDDRVRSLLAAIEDGVTHACVTAERSLLRTLRAGCHAPVGVGSRWDAGRLHLQAVVLATDGRQRLLVEVDGDPSAADELGVRAADELMQAGAWALLSDA